MKEKKRLVGLVIAGILLLTFLTNAALAAPSRTQDKNNENKTGWKVDKQDIHKGKTIKLPERKITIQQKNKTNLPFDKNLNTNTVKKARPDKSDSIK